MLGVDAASKAAIDATLRALGAGASSASSADDALAQLAAGGFAFLIVGESDQTEPGDIIRSARVEPHLARLPIVVLAAARDARALAAPSERAGAGGLPGVLFAPPVPAEVLASQLALLVELHRTRTAAFDAEDQLGQARLDLRDAADTNAALAEQARHALSELASAQTQLVQAAKLAALGELVAGVAHEINNPLSFSISHLGNLRRALSRELARLGELDPEARAEAARIDERIDGVALGLDRIKSLVVKLQTFSRLDEGTMQASNVADAISTVLAILHHRIRDRAHVSTDVGTPETIYCQASLFNQCLMNLIVNAIDAIEPLEGDGNIQISAGAEGDAYVLRVVDNGYGIAPDIQGRVLEPFFTTKPEGKGTGLGLSIAASVVKSHGGSLELCAAEAGGTQAVIRLPLSQVAAHRRAATKAL
jgi:C4-dicarboxylate-specific signal transduction histidine kinase